MKLKDSDLGRIKIAYLDLTCLGSGDRLTELLMAISDAIAYCLNIKPPAEEKLIESPLITFETYLDSILHNNSIDLILAIDEFEAFECLIEQKQISLDFIRYFKKILDRYSNFGIIFSGFHLLEEMTAHYFKPFIGEVTPIKIGLLSQIEVEEFLFEKCSLNFNRAALNKIYFLTHGQPRLVRDIKRILLNKYCSNNSLNSITLTERDVETKIDEDFFLGQKYYFTGLWEQITDGVAEQQEIIKVLASNREGFTKEELITLLPLKNNNLIPAIEALKRFDIIEENNFKYTITIELFRHWVEQRKFNFI